MGRRAMDDSRIPILGALDNALVTAANQVQFSVSAYGKVHVVAVIQGRCFFSGFSGFLYRIRPRNINTRAFEMASSFGWAYYVIEVN